jgi:hypothetical protein
MIGICSKFIKQFAEALMQGKAKATPSALRGYCFVFSSIIFTWSWNGKLLFKSHPSEIPEF